MSSVAAEGQFMDSREFDNFTRTLANDTSRRTALKAAAGGALASVLGLFGLEGADAARDRCRSTGANCDRDRQCCSERCDQEGRKGKICICRKRGGNCVFNGRRRDKACCSNRCRQNGKCA